MDVYRLGAVAGVRPAQPRRQLVVITGSTVVIILAVLILALLITGRR
jgi:hypothetical protein